MLAEQWLLWAGAGAFLLFVTLSFFRIKKLPGYAAFAGCLCIIATMLLRWYTTGRAPWATVYETAAVLALITGVAASYTYRKKEAPAMYLTLSAIAILLLAFSALSWEAHVALAPALDSGWLLVHVPVLILAYGMFAVSFAASAGFLTLRISGKKDKKTYQRLDKVSYMSTIAGLALLFLGVGLGALWAKIVWGAYWSWDPKEIWSAITAIVYLLYLAARLFKLKPEDAALISILGFLSVIFTYFGVTYLIPGLHGEI